MVAVVLTAAVALPVSVRAGQLAGVESIIRAISASTSGVVATQTGDERFPAAIPYAPSPSASIDNEPGDWSDFTFGAPALMQTPLMRAELDACERLEDVLWWFSPETPDHGPHLVPPTGPVSQPLPAYTLAAFSDRGAVTITEAWPAAPVVEAPDEDLGWLPIDLPDPTLTLALMLAIAAPALLLYRS